MKRVLILSVLALLVYCCRAQQPDVECYSIGYVDTLSTNYQDTINNLRAVNSGLINNPVLMYDQVVQIHDTVGYIAELKKVDNDFWFTLTVDDQRFNVWIVNEKLQVWVGDSTKAVSLLGNLCLPMLFDQVYSECYE